MPRTFKFSFPLPGRKPSDEKNLSPASLITPNDDFDDSPLSDPGSKAERILGTMEPATSPHQSKKATRKGLRKKPSFMSVTISETESDGFPFPGMPTSRGSSRRPSYNLRNQPSSPLLGERFNKSSPGTDSMTTDNSSPRPHFYGSSSTLRSYYDPARSPLSISQQTSASSARDMALRKGYPSISSPLSHDASNEISPAAVADDAVLNTNTPAGGRSTKMDMSHPSPNPANLTSPLSSSEEVPKSSTQIATSSNPQPALVGRPSWWKRKKAKEVVQGKGPDQTSARPRLDELALGLESVKTNVKKPKAVAHDWFDTVHEDNSPDVPTEETDADEVHRQFWNKRLNDLQQDAKDTQSSPTGPHEGDHQNKLPNSRDSNPSGFSKSNDIPIRQDSQSTKSYHSTTYVSQQRRRSRSMTDMKGDLSNQSFLELSSSSDDESESYAVQPQNYRRHRIRDSIDQNAAGDDIQVGSAERIKPIKPKAVVNTSPRRSKRESEVIPPVPRIPERPQLQQRISSMKWRESTNNNKTASTSSSGGNSITSQAPSWRPGNDQQTKRSNHGSKLMAVTVEEGELLEAMRKKRANLRQDAFAEGYSKGTRSFSDNQQRPKTAGDNNTGGRVSYFGSDRSNSPPPSLPSLHHNDAAYRSSNNFSDAGSFTFPAVPSSSTPLEPHHLPRSHPRQAPPIVFPPPKASPTSSFNTSDVLPSTPRSRSSPLTPQFSREEVYGGSGANLYNGAIVGNSVKGGGSLGKARHERKRTMSSGVVMLDAVGEGRRGWESEEDGWDMGRGEEKW
ncbi:MAG: hypothetical protein Q9220_005005 [cf. Caloplaca sp. 1 TL-2023]